jgi:hypothetical protein
MFFFSGGARRRRRGGSGCRVGARRGLPSLPLLPPLLLFLLLLGVPGESRGKRDEEKR